MKNWKPIRGNSMSAWAQRRANDLAVNGGARGLPGRGVPSPQDNPNTIMGGNK